MNTGNKLWYTDGQKAVTVSDIDSLLDWLVEEGGAKEGEITSALAMQKVSYVYRCVRLIADAMRASPFRITHYGEDDPWDESSQYENKLQFLPTPKRTIELVARSLLGAGQAYLFKTMQGSAFRELRYMAASTIKPEIDGQLGLTGFERTAGGRSTWYEVDRFLYFWPADETVELGPPKSSPVQAALMSAGADYYTSQFISDFFARGAIKGTLLAVKGNPVEAERNRLKDWWDRTFGRGSKTSWGTEIINADAIDPVKIGEGLESLNNNELTKTMREDIAVAMGIPVSKLLSSSVSGLGGGNVVESDDIQFYRDTVMPLGEFIADVINQQLLHDMGFHWQWLWDTLDVFQQEEKERSLAFKTYVDSGMRAPVAAYMLGIDIPLPGDIPAHYEDSFEEKLEPAAFGLPSGGDDSGLDKEQSGEIAEERSQTEGKARAAEDIDKWERMAVTRYKEGHPEKALDFETELMPEGLVEGIRHALGHCETSDDVRSLFKQIDVEKAVDFEDDPQNAEKRQHETQLQGDLLNVWQEFIRPLVDLAVAEVNPDAKSIGRFVSAVLWVDLARRLSRVLLPRIETMMLSAANDAIDRLPFDIGIDETELSAEVSDWARMHTEELVEGVNETTKDAIRAKVENWIVMGGTAAELEQAIAEVMTSGYRARRIAITEATAAFALARINVWRRSPVITKHRWQTAHDDIVCPICEPLNQTVKKIGDDFLSGLKHPPAHPNCRCWLSPVVG